MFYRNIEKYGNTICHNDNSLNIPEDSEYKERVKMKLKEIIGDRDFMDFIRDAVKELISEL